MSVRRGSWKPARLTNTDTVMVTSALVVVSVLYSLDYGVIGPRNRDALSIVEQAFPLWLWSSVIGAAAVTLLVGISQRIHGLVWTGHAVLSVIYFALTVGVLQGAIEAGGSGIRGAGILAFVAIMHGLFALRMGVTPLSPRDAGTAETIYGGDSSKGS